MEDHNLSVDDLMDSAIKTVVLWDATATRHVLLRSVHARHYLLIVPEHVHVVPRRKCCRNNKPVSYFNFKSSAKHILLYSISRPMSKQSENLIEICFRRCMRWIRKKNRSVGRLRVICALQSVCLGIILFSNLAKTYGSYTKFHLLL